MSTAQPDATNAPTVYKHTFTPGPPPPGLTIQVGRPDTAGTVHPFTYTGCKVSSWTLSSAIGEIVTLAVTVLGRDETTATPLATASYPANLDLLTFVEGSLTVAGSAHEMRSINLQGTNGLADDRYVHGSRLRNEPLEIGAEGSQARVYSGTIEGEFNNLTAYNRFVNGDEAELMLLFAGANIAGAFNSEVKITANVRFDGTTPNVPDGNVIMQTLPVKVIDNGATSSAIWCSPCSASTARRTPSTRSATRSTAWATAPRRHSPVWPVGRPLRLPVSPPRLVPCRWRSSGSAPLPYEKTPPYATASRTCPRLSALD
ncbi:phage tail tube protein [Saccharopolyspora sp. NPDC050389]|uniref:phage tail tube protein n=1 Tax=Saccharopolyspora sp. NPDC050389 TaxID=3155516 RepID=UPI0033E95842